MHIEAADAPGGLNATPGNGQVSLSWTANSESDLDYYDLSDDGKTVMDGLRIERSLPTLRYLLSKRATPVSRRA